MPSPKSRSPRTKKTHPSPRAVKTGPQGAARLAKPTSNAATASPKRTAPSKRAAPSAAKAALDVQGVIAQLEKKSTARDRANLAKFGITANRPVGVSMANLRALAKGVGRNHELARALWATEIYEARMLATLIDDPELVTAAQMEAWCRDFDNWSICDTACFFLFDRTPHAFAKAMAWSRREDEFVKRGGFALFACLALHDRKTGDAPFLEALTLIERGALDERNFVKKGVSWALRAIGTRNTALHTAALATARRLETSTSASACFVARETARDLSRKVVLERIARKKR